MVFKQSLRPCALNESSLSIGRVNALSLNEIIISLVSVSDEIEHLERQLEKNEQRLHRLEDDHNKSISEVKVREQREKEFKKREKLAAEKLRNTERELETKDDLVS